MTRRDSELIVITDIIVISSLSASIESTYAHPLSLDKELVELLEDAKTPEQQLLGLNVSSLPSRREGEHRFSKLWELFKFRNFTRVKGRLESPEMLQEQRFSLLKAAMSELATFGSSKKETLLFSS
ncbi:hypothetical protein PROFUN_12398 [Planoprotostelium fungivorum]|uniref:Uncharacterized protein n=1 Tax=Planoprotostelium fungivorum TaxID=1890364 RepID=A0A2P6N7I2_9EUKA|nr:hypothetical protein PROFUN_12398 [Planoprotostelium fungivorum]